MARRGKQQRFRRLVQIDAGKVWVEWDLKWNRIGIRKWRGKRTYWRTVPQLVEWIDGQVSLPLSNERFLWEK